MHSRSWRERLWCLSEAGDHVLMGADDAVTPVLICDLDGSMTSSGESGAKPVCVDLSSARCGDPADAIRLRKAIGHFPHNERVGSPSLRFVVLFLWPSLLWFFVLEMSTCFGLAFGRFSTPPAKAADGNRNESTEAVAQAADVDIEGDKTEDGNGGQRSTVGCAPAETYEQLMDTGKKSLMDTIFDEYSKHSEEAAVAGYQRLVNELLATASTDVAADRQAGLARHQKHQAFSEAGLQYEQQSIIRQSFGGGTHHHQRARHRTTSSVRSASSSIYSTVHIYSTLDSDALTQLHMIPESDALREYSTQLHMIPESEEEGHHIETL